MRMLQSTMKNLMWFLFFFLDVTTNAFCANPSSLFGVSTTSTTSTSTSIAPRHSSHLLATSKHHSDHFDMEELRQRIQQKYKNPLFDTHGDGDKEEQPQTVNIILFNTGTEQQGAHSIEFPKGSGNNMILAFESKQACRKFADSLKEQNFFDPTPQEFELEELNAMCETLGVFVQVVPEGVEIIPPLHNVKHLGHNPKLQNEKNYLNYIFEMTDDNLDDLEDNIDVDDGGSWD